MNKISLKTRIIRLFQWIPFTWNTVFFTVIFWFLFNKFHQPITKENINDQQLPFIRLMSMFIMVMFIALAALSVLSALATWIYFLVLRNDKKSALEVHFTLEQKGQKQQQFLQASLPKVFRPILGFIKARLEYDNAQLTDKFALLSSHRKKNSLLRNAIAGKSRIELPDIKEYQIKGGVLFFEDLFQIISLPVTQQVAGNFYQSPKRMPETIEDVSPKETDSMDIRIEQLRKVEGDLLHYKDFESGDDCKKNSVESVC